MASEKEFRKKIQQLGTLVGELNEPESNSKIAAREIVQLLMEVHGAGLERIMELVFESGDHGEAIINRLAQDPIARNLLLLYSLHPDDLETRILKALDDVKTRLRKHNGDVEVVSIHEGTVQLRLLISGHACGSTTKNLQSIVEESIYELAPDLTSLMILGSEDESASGFVPLENLLKHSLAAPALSTRGAEVHGVE